MEEYLNNLAERINSSIGSGTLGERIQTALEKVYPEIDQALADYEEFAAKFDGLEDRLKTYVDDAFTETETTIMNEYSDFLSNPWGTFGTYPDPPVTEEPEEPDTNEDVSITDPETDNSSAGTDDTENSDENTSNDAVEKPEIDTSDTENQN